MGLYLGFCGITLLEILEFVILMILSTLGFNPLKTTTSEDASSARQEVDRPRSGRFSAGRAARTAVMKRMAGSSSMAWDTQQPPPGVYMPKDAADRAAMFR